MPDPFAQYAVGSKDDPFSAYVVKTSEAPATVQPLIGHPLTASDETPTWKDRLVNGFVDNPYIQGAAHPKELGDFASLLSYETPAAVIRMARPVIAPVANAAASVLENVKAAKAFIPGANPAKNLIPFEKMAGRLRTIADTSKDAAMGVTRGATPPSQFQRSTDSLARAVEPMAEAESLPVPSHLDLSRQIPASQLTPEQMAEREGAFYARNAQGAPPTQMQGRIVTRPPAEVVPMPSHAPTGNGSNMVADAEAYARRVVPDLKPPDGRVPTGYGTQPDNLLDIAPESSDVAPRSPMQQSRADVGAERVGRAQGLTTDQVRAQTGPIRGEAQGAAAGMPSNPKDRIVEKLIDMGPKGQGLPEAEREAYAARGTSDKTRIQVQAYLDALRKVGYAVPLAAAVPSSVRDMLLERMRAGVTGGTSPQQ